jgi:hypothetical protein
MLNAYARQKRADLQKLYEEEPDVGYYPMLSGREGELWDPLLLHARLAGRGLEDRALQVAIDFSSRKNERVADDFNVSLAVELLEVLKEQKEKTFTPADLIPSLKSHETWGELLESKGSEKAQAGAVDGSCGPTKPEKPNLMAKADT